MFVCSASFSASVESASGIVSQLISVGALISCAGVIYGVAISSSLHLTVAAFADILVQIAVPRHMLFADGTVTERANGSRH